MPLLPGIPVTKGRKGITHVEDYIFSRFTKISFQPRSLTILSAFQFNYFKDGQVERRADGVSTGTRRKR